RERGLADARNVLDQQVPAREQAREREAHLSFLAEDHGARGFDHARDGRGGDGLQMSLQEHAAIVPGTLIFMSLWPRRLSHILTVSSTIWVAAIRSSRRGSLRSRISWRPRGLAST